MHGPLRQRAGALGVVLLLMPGIWHQAAAQGHAEYVRHLRAGDRLLDAGQPEAALAEYLAAREIHDQPMLSCSIGHIHLQLGHGAEALAELEMCRERNHDLGDRERARLAQELEQARQARSPKAPAGPLPPVAPPQNSVPAQGPPPPLQRPARPERPRWRLATGLALTGAGLGLAGIGIPALAIDGQCIGGGPLNACPQIYDTLGLGLGLTISGSAVAITGIVLASWPGGQRRGQAVRALPAGGGGR